MPLSPGSLRRVINIPIFLIPRSFVIFFCGKVMRILRSRYANILKHRFGATLPSAFKRRVMKFRKIKSWLLCESWKQLDVLLQLCPPSEPVALTSSNFLSGTMPKAFIEF